MAALRLIPLEDAVILPGMPVTLSVDLGADDRVLLVPRQGKDFAKVGVVAEVSERVQMAGRGFAVSLIGRHRAIPGSARTDRNGRLQVEVDERPDVIPPKRLTEDLERSTAPSSKISSCAATMAGSARSSDRSPSRARSRTPRATPRSHLHPEGQLLEALDVVDRLTLALKLQKDRLTELHVRKRIREDVESGAQKQQRDYFLHRQMDAIKKELGDSDGSIVDEYRKKIDAAGMPEKVKQQAERELSRFERMGDQNAESSMIRTYLDWLLAVP
jgi:ATP-dependent Lon protease